MAKTVIIIGGGVVGLNAAYYLARQGGSKVCLIEKGAVGDGSSSRAAGIITGLLWSETGVVARKKSLHLFRQMSEDLQEYEFHNVGCLNLFDSSSWREREQLLPLYDSAGAPYEILRASEIRRRWPSLHPTDEFVGLFDPAGGYSEAQEFVPALAKRVQELGVRIREGELVNDILQDGKRVVGIRTESETLMADAVVCCVHSWTQILLERAGLQLPVKSFVHQRYVTTGFPDAIRIPAVNANPLLGYFRPASGSRLLAGIETPERLQQDIASRRFHYSSLSSPEGLRQVIKERFAPLLRCLGTASWESESVGLITFSMDGEPILGPVSELPGLYIGVAFHSGGFAYSPVAGMLLAEFVDSDRTSIDVRAFSPNRFNSEEVAMYLRSPLCQKDVVRRRH